MDAETTCPVPHDRHDRAKIWGMSNRDWWPNQLHLGMLNQH